LTELDVMFKKLDRKSILLVLMFLSNLVTPLIGFYYGYKLGINQIMTLLEESGVKIIDLGNGKYKFIFPYEEIEFTVVLHCLVWHFRKQSLISFSSHPVTLTNFGKDWIADKLSGASSTNFMLNATWIGMSNSSLSVDVTWTILPEEITTDGLSRAEGNVIDTGTGTWNVTKTFSVTGTNSTKLYGLYLNAYNGATLIAAEQQGIANQKNLQSGDTLKITIQGSIS